MADGRRRGADVDLAALSSAQRAQLEIALRGTLDRDGARAYTSLGQLLLQASRPREALHALAAARKLGPNDARAALLEGTALQLTQPHEYEPAAEAAHAFATYLHLMPLSAIGASDASMVYNNMGQALSTSERVGEAAAAYARAITLDPTNGVAYRSLTGLHASLGDAPAAAAAARAAIDLLPSDAGQWLLLGKAHTWGADPALEREWVRSMRAGLKSASGTSGAPPLKRATWHFALYHGLRGARSRPLRAIRTDRSHPSVADLRHHHRHRRAAAGVAASGRRERTARPER